MSNSYSEHRLQYTVRYKGDNRVSTWACKIKWQGPGPYYWLTPNFHTDIAGWYSYDNYPNPFGFYTTYNSVEQLKRKIEKDLISRCDYISGVYEPTPKKSPESIWRRMW